MLVSNIIIVIVHIRFGLCIASDIPIFQKGPNPPHNPYGPNGPHGQWSAWSDESGKKSGKSKIGNSVVALILVAFLITEFVNVIKDM